MNNSINFIILALTLVTSSCEGLFPTIENETSVKVSFSFDDCQLETKARRITVDDSEISETILMVFKNKGERVLYETSPDRAFPLCDLPGNCNLDIFAIINPSIDFTSVDTYVKLKAKKAVYNKRNYLKFEMISHIDTVLKKDCNVILPINRIASKITLKSIRYRDLDCDNDASHFMDAIFLMDMSASCPYTFDNFVPVDYLDSSWSQDLSYIDTGLDSPEYYYSNYISYYHFTGPFNLYCYPNTGPKPTKLVLQVQGYNGHNGNICSHYYTFSLPDLLPNHQYIVEELFIDNSSFGEYPGDNDYCLYSADYIIEEIDSSSGKLENVYRGEEVEYVKRLY